MLRHILATPPPPRHSLPAPGSLRPPDYHCSAATVRCYRATRLPERSGNQPGLSAFRASGSAPLLLPHFHHHHNSFAIRRYHSIATIGYFIRAPIGSADCCVRRASATGITLGQFRLIRRGFPTAFRIYSLLRADIAQYSAIVQFGPIIIYSAALLITQVNAG